ncbi:MAG TPA: hypothetical protein VEJ84_24660 [Acidimicrobiales bacterium]|nr:hypothetical protein [Acidimicrobiales bacterium]
MELAGYLVNAVVLEHRPVAEVAQAHGVLRSWLHELLARHRALGEAAFVPVRWLGRTGVSARYEDGESDLASCRRRPT